MTHFGYQILNDPVSSSATSKLLIPIAKNFAAFDAFLFREGQWWPIQITRNEEKTLKPSLLSSFFKTCPSIQKRWLGIVPPTSAFRKLAFSYEKPDGCDECKIKKKLKQFVIPFPSLDEDTGMFTNEDRETLLTMRLNIFKYFPVENT